MEAAMINRKGHLLLLLLCLFVLLSFSFAQSPPKRCYRYASVNPVTDCFIEVGGSPGNCLLATPCGSFQQAIDADCNTVVVSPGTYSGVENRDLTAGNLSNIVGAGPVGSVVVDLELQGRFITFGPLNETEVSIVNVTIMNGYFTFNTTTAGGGAILLVSRTFTFTNVEFLNNTIQSLPSTVLDRTTRGGAFIATAGQGIRSGTVCGCTFEANRVIADTTEFGRGGAFVDFNYHMMVWGSAFRNNSVYSDNIGTGGAIHHNGGVSPLLTDINVEYCNFCNNSAIHGGGALYMVLTDNSQISHNVFLTNSALNGVLNANLTAEEAFGGAIQDFTNQGSSTYFNNTYKGNSAVGPNSGGAISYRNGFNFAASGFERFCNNTAANATAIYTEDDISYGLGTSQFQCQGPESTAIEPGTCTSGCQFLPNDGDVSCELCALPGFQCEAILVIPPVSVFV